VNSITTVDLFAGAGGTSTGLVAAARSVSSRVNLTAINHNRKALETHKANFPWATHILTELQYVDPAEVVPEGRLDGLVASPECTFFSRARGGKPIRPQDRASPWYLGRWIHKLDVPWVLIENVPEITR
jgi:DNA (cytosine-5)-methyltransferase 1